MGFISTNYINQLYKPTIVNGITGNKPTKPTKPTEGLHIFLADILCYNLY